jgi:hypothetical protein
VLHVPPDPRGDLENPYIVKTLILVGKTAENENVIAVERHGRVLPTKGERGSEGGREGGSD